MKRVASALVAAVGLHLLVFAWTPAGLLSTSRLHKIHEIQKLQKKPQPAQQLALRLVPSALQIPDPVAGPSVTRPAEPIVPPSAAVVPPVPPVARTQEKTRPVHEASVTQPPRQAEKRPPVAAASPPVEEPAPARPADRAEVGGAADPLLPAVKADSPPRVPEEVRAPTAQADAAAADAVQSVPPAAVASVEAVPLYRQNPPPVYPRVARQRRWQGTVLLEVLVSDEGLPQDIRIVASSGHEVLDRAAEKAVAGWLFAPGRRNDVPEAMLVRVPVRFELTGR